MVSVIMEIKAPKAFGSFQHDSLEAIQTTCRLWYPRLYNRLDMLLLVIAK